MISLKLFLKEFEQRYFYERPSKKYRERLLSDLSPLDKTKLLSDFNVLDKDGILILPEYFKNIIPNLNQEFQKLLSDFSKSVGRVSENDNKEDIGHYSISNKGLLDSYYTSQVAIDKYLTKIFTKISQYWK